MCGNRAMAPELRCLIVDDQPATLDRLARMLRADRSVAEVSAATDSVGALRSLREVDVDVVFTEVLMPGMDGMELAWIIRRFRNAPAIVFVTRHPGRAAEAFDLGAVDYLSKPPPQERLAESLRRVLAVRPADRPAPAPAPHADDEVIPVELGGVTKLVPRSEVRWVQARGDYARLHTADGSYLIRARTAALADRWRAAGLVQIHRSYLVQRRYVSEVRGADSGRLTVVVDGKHLPVSRRMAPRLRRDLLTHPTLTA
jgi:DNA-binding LytR/AlgR family response regulator